MPVCMLSTARPRPWICPWRRNASGAIAEQVRAQALMIAPTLCMVSRLNIVADMHTKDSVTRVVTLARPAETCYSVWTRLSIKPVKGDFGKHPSLMLSSLPSLCICQMGVQQQVRSQTTIMIR